MRRILELELEWGRDAIGGKRVACQKSLGQYNVELAHGEGVIELRAGEPQVSRGKDLCV